ncbi:uncharacterized protein LOC143995708 [Lithobates pipiens]
MKRWGACPVVGGDGRFQTGPAQSPETPGDASGRNCSRLRAALGWIGLSALRGHLATPGPPPSCGPEACRSRQRGNGDGEVLGEEDLQLVVGDGDGHLPRCGRLLRGRGLGAYGAMAAGSVAGRHEGDSLCFAQSGMNCS